MIFELHQQQRNSRSPRQCVPGLFVDVCIAFIIFLVVMSLYSTDLHQIKRHIWVGAVDYDRLSSLTSVKEIHAIFTLNSTEMEP